ncbi:MAG: cytochrome-c peroxidase [Hellea sp.]|nr:cytochrome-c peroxidase [Hellea sp.]
MRKVLLLSVFSMALSACGASGGDNPVFLQTGGSGGGSGGGNSAPDVALPNSDQSAPVGHDFAYDATQGGQTFTDAQGDNMSFAVTFAPDNGDFTVAAGMITGRSSAPIDVAVTITANDGTQSSAADEFVIASDYDQDAIVAAFGGSIDLAALADYETITVPDFIRAPNDVASPVTNAGATLGRVLFYDTALSIDDTVSCSSCHQQASAFSDTQVVSNGVAGGVTGRHSMRLINTQWSDEAAFFWDERAVDLEDQVTDPIRDHNEHGFSGQDGRPNFDDLIVKLEAIDYYDELFAFTFGTPDITEERMQSALAQFVNSIVSFDSRFDEGRAQQPDIFQPFPNFTFDENEGKNIYMSGPADNGAGCRRCHADPEFSVFQDSGHIGVIGVAGDPSGTDFTNTRSPSLRDLFAPDGTANGPFMHDGSLATMRAVIDHYDAIPVPTTEPTRTEFMNSIDPQLVEFGTVERLNLTDIEKDQVEAFLRTLTGQTVYSDVKWSSPF